MTTAERRQTKEHFQELTTAQGWALLDERAQRYLQMSGQDFVRRWEAQDIENPDRPEVLRVAMLLPFVR